MRWVLIGNLGVDHGTIKSLVLLPISEVNGRKDCWMWKCGFLVGLLRGWLVIPTDMLRSILSLSEVGEERRGAIELLDIECFLVPLLKVYIVEGVSWAVWSFPLCLFQLGHRHLLELELKGSGKIIFELLLAVTASAYLPYRCFRVQLLLKHLHFVFFRLLLPFQIQQAVLPVHFWLRIDFCNVHISLIRLS